MNAHIHVDFADNNDLLSRANLLNRVNLLGRPELLHDHLLRRCALEGE